MEPRIFYAHTRSVALTSPPTEKLEEKRNDENQATSPKRSCHYRNEAFLRPGRRLGRGSDFHLDSEIGTALRWNEGDCADRTTVFRLTIGIVMNDESVASAGRWSYKDSPKFRKVLTDFQQSSSKPARILGILQHNTQSSAS